MESEPKTKRVLIKVTREFEDGSVKEIDFEYENVSISQKRGLTTYRNMTTGHAENIITNGQGVLVISAWKGCKDLDSFVACKEIQVL